jgi:hypothetical protein
VRDRRGPGRGRRAGRRVGQARPAVGTAGHPGHVVRHRDHHEGLHRAGQAGHRGDITALTVPFEPSVQALRFDRLPDARARDPEVLRRLCGEYTMGPIGITVAMQGGKVLTVAVPGAPPFELQPGRGLRFEVKGQPGVTAEFELDEAGAVTRLVVQPLGIFYPKA